MSPSASGAIALRDVSLDDNTPRSGLLRRTLTCAQRRLRGSHKYAVAREARHG